MDAQSDELKGVVRRLKKILALASSSNPGEAAAALHQAQVLMRKHGLTQPDVDVSCITESSFELASAQLGKNDAHLVGIVKTALAVEVLVKHSKKARGFKRPAAQIIFVGEAHRVEIAKYAFVQLRRQLAACMKATFEQLLLDCGCAKTALRIDAKRRDAYGQSWACAVLERVKELAPPRATQLNTYLAFKEIADRKAPRQEVMVQDDPITQFMALKGHSDGRKTQIHPAVRSHQSTPLALAA